MFRRLLFIMAFITSQI